jgi:hypothetical protein
MEISDQKASSMLMPLPERDAIIKTCLDYAEGWYTGDVTRMQRSLHPDLVKRTLDRDPDQNTWQLTPARNAEYMVSLTREGGGSALAEPRRVSEVTILDVYQRTASVKVISHEYVDYLHLAKFEQGWMIVNVLWEYLDGEQG